MIKMNKAMDDAYASIVNILQNANLKNGIDVANISSETSIMFWEGFLKSDLAAKKETYIVFNFSNISTIDFGDGEALSRVVRVRLTIFTLLDRRTQKISDLIDAIEEKTIEAKWLFDLEQEPSYDPDNKLHQLVFTISSIFS